MIVTRDLLERVAAWAEEKVSPPNNSSSPSAREFDIQAFIGRARAQLGLEISGPHSTADGQEWRFSGGCPFQPDYADGHAAIFQKTGGQLGFHCFCGDHPTRSWQDLRELIDGSKEQRRRSAQRPAGTEAAGALNLLTQPFNDYGNGQRIVARHGPDLRYCHAFNTWLVYTGQQWLIDRIDAARKLVQDTMLDFAQQAMESGNEAAVKFAGGCLNSQRITAAMREAEPHLPVTVDDLDTNPDLLNFANCTVDLRTGRAHTHRREDLVTKIIRHPYNPDAQCPRFSAFLGRVLPGLEDYLQKAIGYSLTAHTSEKAVLVCHGLGNNGKTTLLATIREIVGEYYAVLLQIDTLMTRSADNNAQADLADLRGARFAMTSETEEGQRLSEGKLKRITQGMGRIKAVRKYENPVEFTETHKLWIDCNHKPIVRGNDQAIWNRLHLVPFDVTIPAEEIDRDLPAKLVSEAEGILAWSVAGAVRWYAEGLGKPEAVEAAGREWRSDMDSVGRFAEDCCMTGDFFQAKARTLYSAYRKWAESVGEQPVTETTFGNTLRVRGFNKKHTKSGTIYTGIGLSTDSQCGEG